MTGNFDANKYVGLRYLAGGRDVDGEVPGVDCWGLVRLVYDREFGIKLPGHDGVNRDTTSDEDLADYAAAQMEDWERVRNPEPGDMVRLRIRGNPMHVGIVTAPGDFLHVRAGNDSVVDRYRSRLWADRVEGFYRYTPRSTGVVVSGCPHPLRMARIDGEATAGCSLASVIYGHCAAAGVPEDLAQYGIAFVNGRRVALEDWPIRILVDGDRVEFRMLPGKEGGGLRVILTIAVMVVAAWASAGASAAWTSAGYGAAGSASAGAVGALAGMAVTMAGTALVNAIAPIRPAQLGSDDKGTSYKPQYMLAGGQNQAAPYAAFPIVLGHHDFTGPLGANSYISSNGADRFLHIIIVWGYGPLDVHSLRIGSTPLTDYQDIDAITLNGDADEYVDGKLDWSNPEVAALLNIYGSDIHQQSPEVELDTAWTERTTTERDVTRLQFLLSFPQGLVDIDEDDGKKQVETVTVQLEYRRLGYYDALGVWVPVSESWHGNWSNVPGLGWNNSSDKTGLDVKTIVFLRGPVLAFKTNVGGWSIQAAGVVTAAWPTLAPGEVLIHKIQNGGLVSSHNAGRYTGFGVSFRTITTSRVEREWNTMFWVESAPITESYVQFSVASGAAVGTHTYSNKSNDPFDSTLFLDVSSAPGQYEVRLRRTTVSRTDSGISDKVYWLTLTEEVQNRRPISPPKPMAMTALRIRATNQMNGSLDGITATLATRQLQWNGTAWVAPTPAQRRNNPASLYLLVLQHPASARPVPDAEIDFDQLGHWYEFCETKGFIYENVITGQRPLPEVLADIAAAGRASPSNLDGKWSVVIDEPKTKIAQHFTAHNSWGFEGSRLLPKLPHGLRVNFLNREKDYQPDELIVYNDGYNADNATLLEAIELPGVTSAGTLANPGPIFKLARFHLEQLILRPEEYYKYTEIEGLIATRGDRVKSNHDVPMWGLGSGRIKSVIGDVTGVVIDETVQMTVGKNYTIRWRTAANETNTATITGITGVFDTLNFTTTISANKPADGDLFMFGELNSESVDCLVKHVEPIGNFQARLTLVDYAPALFDAESKAFGTWESKITEPPLLLRLELAQKPIVETVTTDEKALTRNGSALQTNILIKFSATQGRNSAGASEALSKNAAMVEVQYRLDATVASGVPFKPMPMVPVKAGSIYVPAEDKTTYDLRMRLIGEDGRNGPWLDLPDVYVSGKTNPPPAVTGIVSTAAGARIQLDWTDSADLDVDSYEVRLNDTDWGVANSMRVYAGSASICYYTPPISGNVTFYFRSIDMVGNWSPTVSHVFAYPAANSPAFLTAEFSDTALTAAIVTLKWGDVETLFGLKDYQITYDAVTLYVNASTKDLPADWVGNRTFTVRARDVNGDLGAARSISVTMSLPAAISGLKAQVVDNNVLLYWTLPAKTSLPIQHVRLKRGATWATATDIGTKSGSFTSIFETQGGSFTYWAAAVDTEDHEGPAVSVQATVNQPPDYVFSGSMTSALAGTLSSAVLLQGKVYLPVNTTETFGDHFSTRSWATPQAQVTASYPIFIQPAAGSGYYEEVFNFGTVFPATKATANIDGMTVAGSPVVISTISLSLNGSTWTDYAGVSEVFGTNFQYVKVRVAVTSGGVDLYELRGLSVRLDAKLKSDAGSIAALSTDASGTIANFNVEFVDVTSVTVSPGGTSRITAVYDYKDTVLTGSYNIVSNVATVDVTAHGLIVAQKVRLNFTSGSAPSGTYTVATAPTANQYTVALTTANTSGNVSTYPQSMRIYLFDSAGSRYTGPASWAVRGY